MAYTTYQIYQTNNKAQLKDIIELEVTEPLTGTGSAKLTVGGIELKPQKMNNWTCYDRSAGMIWVFTPDVLCERDSTNFEFADTNRDPRKFASMIGYTFLTISGAELEDGPPTPGSGSGGNDGHS